MTEMAVTDAQFEATVGNVNSGLSSLSATYLPVSHARPPPTANIMSASLTVGFAISASPFSYVESPPYSIKSSSFTSLPATPSIIAFLAFAIAVFPPMTAAVLPKNRVTCGISL